jgi:hypothetical protein
MAQSLYEIKTGFTASGELAFASGNGNPVLDCEIVSGLALGITLLALFALLIVRLEQPLLARRRNWFPQALDDQTVFG